MRGGTNMERSGSQKVLLIVSILQIIGAAFTLFVGIMALFGAGASSHIITGDPDLDVAARLGAGAVFSIASMIALFSGGWSLICGILGVRAANDNQKIMIVWVFSLIALILQILTVILAVFDGTFGQNWLSYLTSLIWPGIMFGIANNIKIEAGK